MSDRPSFFEELKQRRVVRVGLVYLPVAWAVVMGANELTEILALPAWTPRLVLALALLGFPVALGLAWALQVTDRGVERAVSSSRRSTRVAFLGGLAIGLVSIAATAFLLRGNGDGGTAGELDHDRVVIYPLRAQVPSELERLGEGLSDLLSFHFDGEVGPTAVSFGAVSSAARGGVVDAEAVARTFGAGLVVSGSVVGSTSNVVVQVELRHLDGDEPVQQARAEGHPDSMTVLTNRLAAQLLGLETGEYREALPYLSGDVQAVKRYLAGRQAWRDGDYWVAVDEFDGAIAADSTFALAAIGRADAANMALGAGGGGGLALASRHRERLGPSDQLYLDTRLAPAELQTGAQALGRWAATAAALPDRVEAQYFHAEIYVHRRYWGDDDWADRAVGLFERALALDPRHVPSLEHIWFVRTIEGTPEQRREIASRLVEIRGGGTMLDGIAAGTDQLSLEIDSLQRLTDQDVFLSVQTPVGYPDQLPSDFLPYVEASVAELYRRALTTADIAGALDAEVSMNAYLGRAGRVRESIERQVAEFGRPVVSRQMVLDDLWGVGHPGLARQAEAGLRERLAGKSPADFTADDLQDLATLETASFMRDPEYAGGEAARILRDAIQRSPEARGLAWETMALAFEAWSAIRRNQTGVDEKLARIDELVRQGPNGHAAVPNFLRLARILEEYGRPARALEFLDSRPTFTTFAFLYIPEGWEWAGRLALASGDTARAIREFGRYVKVRAWADAELQPDLERVRTELAQLVAR